MQKIFDTDNKEDMQDLWNILPDKIVRIFLEQIECFDRPRTMVEYLDTQKDFFTSLIAIDWHDKTEVTRPVNYEDMIGCVGWVGNSRDARDRIGILNSYYKGSGYPFETTDGDEFAFFTPVKKSEIKIYGEDK